MKKIKYLFFAVMLSVVLIDCTEKDSNDPKPQTNTVNELLEPYCPVGPNSCGDTLITIEGFLDSYNVTTEKFALWPNGNKTPTVQDAFNNSFIEVYYPESDLSKYFSACNDIGYYPINANYKVLVHKAKIHVFIRDCEGVDDGNFLSVDSISQIDFFRIESDGSLTKL